ncbi:MAG TPA: hypothetical protein VIG29_06215, partial [Vicinamibacteria bacterium]
MKLEFLEPVLILAFVAGCSDGRTGPTTTTTTTAPAPSFEIKTLLTVYPSAEEDALWTEGTTQDERIGRILLGVDALTEGTTAIDNEGLRDQLQAAIERIDEQFRDADYLAAFDESKENLLRFLNDADSDGWSIDG